MLLPLHAVLPLHGQMPSHTAVADVCCYCIRMLLRLQVFLPLQVQLL